MKTGLPKKKNILIMVNSTRLSGAELSLIETVSKLSVEKYSFFFLIPFDSDFRNCVKGKHSIKEIRLIRFKRNNNPMEIAKFLLNLLFSIVAISKYILKNKIDIIYSNSIQAQIYCLPVKFTTGRKLVWHVRDSLTSKIAKYFFSYCSDKVICVSEYIYDQLPIKLSNKQVIYNGIDLEFWDASLHTLETRSARRDKNKVLIGCIGQIIPWKRPFDLVVAAEQIVASCHNVHFLFIGDDLFNEHSDYVNQIKNEVARRGLNSSISFIGCKTDVREIMNNLDIIVHCAYNEPFGRVVLEGMALKKPVVAYKCGGVPEIVVDNSTGFLVEPLNINLLTKKIVDLVDNGALRTKFGENARSEVERKFSPETNKNMTEFVLDSL